MAVKGGGVVALFAMHIILARLLGSKDYGQFAYATNLANFLALFLSLGLTSGLLRYYEEYRQRREWQRLKGYMRATVGITVATTSVAIIAILIWAWLFDPDSVMQQTLLLVGLLLPVAAFVRIRKRSLQAIRLPALSIGLDEVLLPILVVIGFLVLPLPLSGSSAIIIYIASSLLVAATGALLISRSLPTEYHKARANYDRLQEWVKRSMPMMLGGLSQLLIKRTDIIMLGILTSMEFVGLYAIAIKISSLVLLSNTAVAVTHVPQMSEAYQLGQADKFGALYRSAALAAAVVSGPIFIAILFYPSLILAFFGPDYVAATSVLLLLTLGQLPNAILGPSGNALIVSGYERFFAISLATAAGLNVIGNYFMITWYGMVGAAITTAFILFGLKVLHFWTIIRSLRTESQ